MMDGSVTVDQQTGKETVMEGPENTWQNIGTLPGGEEMGGTDIFAMCNINMVFMGVSAFICLFIADDFRSGYAKNLFTERSKRGEYVISKILAGFLCGTLMLIAYFVGSVIGGAVSGLSFDLCGLNAGHIVMCMLSKIFLILVFVSIFTLISIIAKQRAWISVLGSLAGGMLLFMMVSMISPLNSTIVNVGLCAVGGALFALGLGAISRVILNKTSLV
jgi:ABC-type transport system involved in multi-copper enzyme maturation permease subunit